MLDNDFINYLKYQKNYSNHTIINYQHDLKDYFIFLKNKSIKQTNYKDIYDYINELYKKNYSKTTISRKISTLKSYYKYLMMQGIIKENPLLLITNPKKDKKLPKYLTINELEEIIEVINNDEKISLRDKLIIELLYATGIRVSELVNIKVSDIDLHTNKIKVYGKGSKERIVLFGNICKNLIIDYIEHERIKYLKNEQSKYLLINNKKTPLTDRGVRLVLDKIISKTTIKTKISPHTLRHTFATHMLNEGADLVTVKELLGHENLSTTSIYTHISNERLREVYRTSHPRSRK